MATYTRIQLRRDTQENWMTNNPVLVIGEAGVDMTLNKMKIGNGTDVWADLPWLDPDTTAALEALINMCSKLTGTGTTGVVKDPVDAVADLTTTYPSPSADWIVLVRDEGKFYTWDGTSWTLLEMAATGGTSLTDTDVKSLVASSLDDYGRGGIGYTITEFGAYDKPVTITFDDGVVCTLTWNATVLTRAVYSRGGTTLETVVYNYDTSGRHTGNTVTRA